MFFDRRQLQACQTFCFAIDNPLGFSFLGSVFGILIASEILRDKFCYFWRLFLTRGTCYVLRRFCDRSAIYYGDTGRTLRDSRRFSGGACSRECSRIYHRHRIEVPSDTAAYLAGGLLRCDKSKGGRVKSARVVRNDQWKLDNIVFLFRPR